jgi:NADH-quinone oxidoreductase subunit M
VASLLFGVVGRMVYERAHTRELDELATMQLAKQMPFVAVVFVIGGLASMGLPGLSGFVAELAILVGAWPRLPGFVIIASAGIVITVWYTLRTMLVAFFGEGRPAGNHGAAHALDPITWPEKAGAVFLVFWLVLLGLFPSLLLDPINEGVRLMLPSFASGSAPLGGG